MDDERQWAGPAPRPLGIDTGRITLRLAIPLHDPLWTYVLLAANVLVWVAMTALGGSENPVILVLFGAKYTPLILAGQYWRLLTAIFIHVGVVHLVFNAYALFSFGIEVERRFGRTRFLVLYLLSGIASTTASFVGSPTLSAGASGAVFGLAGASVAYFLTYRHRLGAAGQRSLRSILVVVGLNLVMGFAAPGIDNLGHIGGLIAGLWLGWVYCPQYAAPRLSPMDVAVGMPSEGALRAIDRTPTLRLWAGTLLAVVVLGIAIVLGTWRWM
ncbi:MAG TPA: rhomboid family intramembrane serine protease [Chloroflexi bacterium]|jgi:membrane associated rhomboid family serine protease|nr:rhomboid family intramembrane serine protease [Chloroflexota bacterium]